jgi:hypothetical protein
MMQDLGFRSSGYEEPDVLGYNNVINPLKVNQYFRGAYSFHLQGQRVSQALFLSASW